MGDNKSLVDLLESLSGGSNVFVPKDLPDELQNSLINAEFICPFEDDMITPFEEDKYHYLPVFSDIDEFKKFYATEYKIFKFKDLSKYLKFFMVGIIINPLTLNYVILKNLANMIFYKIKDDEKADVLNGYDVKVRLNNLKPLTWRDLIIPENITFMELDDILKTLWDFEGHHLSSFLVKKDDLLIIDGDLSKETMMDGDFNANITLINDFFDKYNKITYWYDFTDDWFFDIEIKKKIDYNKKYVTIKRFKGKYNPIDDCGGVEVLSDIIDLKENDDDYDEFDEHLKEFDMERCQELLKKKDYVFSTWYEDH